MTTNDSAPIAYPISGMVNEFSPRFIFLSLRCVVAVSGTYSGVFPIKKRLTTTQVREKSGCVVTAPQVRSIKNKQSNLFQFPFVLLSDPLEKLSMIHLKEKERI
jgi:hypothetical protein